MSGATVEVTGSFVFPARGRHIAVMVSNGQTGPDWKLGEYVTLVAPAGTSLGGVSTHAARELGTPPAGVEFPYGLFEFAVAGDPTANGVIVDAGGPALFVGPQIPG